ncbi:MAG: type II toxin-antitoxin system VapC family toxin [Desulfobacteraceae bacterium]|nr:type II toxin-antitoxin system VapC family toxin [Desulfobacteraceae bacterium]
MQSFIYPVTLTPDKDDGGFVVKFVDLPEAITQGENVNALKISKQANMYAYDAYFLDCAIRHKVPLLTLDRKLKKAALNLNVETMEV